jgi:hypothetical protein
VSNLDGVQTETVGSKPWFQGVGRQTRHPLGSAQYPAQQNLHHFSVGKPQVPVPQSLVQALDQLQGENRWPSV